MADTTQVEIATVQDLLVDRLNDLSTWSDFAAAMQQLFDSNVAQPINTLQQVRYLEPGTEQALLAATCRLLGFDLEQDVLNLNVDTFTKLVTTLPLYADQNGTPLFSRFLSLLLNGTINIKYLWTQDYVDFLEKALGELVYDGGAWYATTHVELGIGLATIAGLSLRPGQTLIDRIKEIFYSQAPITLVLERIVLEANADMQVGIVGKTYPAGSVKTVYLTGGIKGA